MATQALANGLLPLLYKYATAQASNRTLKVMLRPAALRFGSYVEYSEPL
jgi:hypothetical protein